MILCGTGHRPDKLGGYVVPNPVEQRVRRQTYAALDTLRPKLVITGMAQGFDTILAECAYDMGIPFWAATPHEDFPSRWPKQAQEWYHNILGKAARVTVVCRGTFHINYLQKRNEWMVDHSQLVLACWDGSFGGTWNCLKYAERQKKPIHYLPFKKMA